ncbi:transmembrane protein, putative (macronuclear) [Tetrahymena thermophila SB210]|uniref:Transmembrane protein, putative n=1 Tax=Tetrahymena thermophila (strain SB210) TaxID=312017 RepID=A4VDY7_TETTS|nr:transmembrane protein, putative [Tetrahymena thermophila SB210]EDK31730.2 transmembrane protein, putative [Tetrahymena thermophila SB210]|eukprot:XP_001471337.2 transmembrane protein, putative [Tetrahymena thermophila SB210]
MNLFSKADLFSQPFNFYIGNQQTKKGTFQGALISLVILTVVISYFIYLVLQYFNNKIDPKFRSQMFTTDETTEITLNNDLFAFKFQYASQTSLDQYQQQMNKTYIVPIAFFIYSSADIYFQTILNITECKDPQLQGYSCVDFSGISNYTLIQSVRNNVRSQFQLFYFPCSFIDDFKTTAPNNCANQTEIEDFVNEASAGLNLKLQTHQFNISSQQNQVNYMRKFIFTESDQYILSRVSAQQQITKVSQGLIIQSENEYSGPINYNSQNSVFSNNFDSPYLQVIFEMDQIVQIISIQFPIIPDILALANSAFALFLSLGFIFRMISQRGIFQDFLHIFLQNVYQDTYEIMLKANKVCQNELQINKTPDQVLEKANEEEVQEKEIIDTIFIPNFSSKFRSILEQSPSYKQNTQDANYQKDEIIETSELNQAAQAFDNSQDNQYLVNDQQVKQLSSPNNASLSQSSNQQIIFQNSNNPTNNSQNHQNLNQINLKFKNNNLKNNCLYQKTKEKQVINLECFINKLRMIKDHQFLSENQKNKRHMETMEKQIENQILRRLNSKIQKIN